MYQRCLSAILPFSESKEIIREKVDIIIMGINGYLFGNEFNNDMADMKKAKNLIIVIYSKPSVSKPFLAGPSPSKKRSGGSTKHHFLAKETREVKKAKYGIPELLYSTRQKLYI